MAAMVTGDRPGVPEPIDPEQSAEFLRQRLALWAASFTLLSITAWIATNLAGVAWLGRTWAGQLAHPGNRVALAAPVPLAIIWGICRFGRPSRRVLDWLDAGGTFLFCLGWTMMSYHAPSASHPGLDLGAPPSPNPPIGIFANMAALYLRAAVLPSTARRTLIISCVSSLPIVIVALLVQRAHGTLEATSFALGTTLLSIWVVPGPAIVSWVIYRLRQQVREARQLGLYTLEGKIGEGGMGVVYRARHALLRRPTAIKLLSPERSDADDVTRFAREVQQTSRLTHPNNIAIYDYGHTADGVFYYAMEYLDGVSLQELVELDGPQPAGRVVHILRQACGALAEAHSAGLVHRDVKPANLHLCVRGGVPDFVKVLDFGLVKEMEAAPDAPTSEVNALIGTPQYMAPEAITRSADIDGRSDLYALGAVGYYLLTGSPPFSGSTIFEVCGQHLHLTPEPPSQRLGAPVPADLEQLILRCLAKRPEDRPPSAIELGRALSTCTDAAAWEGQADRWWRERAAVVVAQAGRRRSRADSSAGQATVAVDLVARG